MYSYDNDGFGAFLGASIFIYILLFALCIFIICFIAKKMCEVAELKGYNPSQKHIFAICFWLGLFGVLYVIALPDLRLRKLLGETDEKVYTPNREEKTSVIKREIQILENGDWRCPCCGSSNPANDKRCYCGFKRE